MKSNNNSIAQGDPLVSFDIPVYKVIDHFSEKYPHNTAIRYKEREISFSMLKNDTDRLAASLQKLHVNKGDTVGIALANCPEFIISVLACMKAGAICVNNMSPFSTEKELLYQIRDSQCTTVIIPYDQYIKFRKLYNLSQLKNIILVNTTDNSIESIDLTIEKDYYTNITYIYQDLVAEHNSPEVKEVSQSLDDVAILQYTSGTTGVFKGAMITHRNLCFMTQACIAQSLGMEANEKALVVLPISHIYILSVGVLTPLVGASTVILDHFFKVQDLFDLFNRHRPTYFVGVPALFASMNQFKKLGFQVDLSSVRSFLCGGAPLLPEVWQEFKDLFEIELCEGYGSSECSPIISCNLSGNKKPIKKGSVGVPFYNTKITIDDPHKDGSGEILVKGPQVMKGYWNMPEETDNVFTDNWLRTGDIGRIDDDGYLYIVGRKKDIICVGGYNVFPGECDELLQSHPSIKEACVAGVPHKYLGEQIAAFVVLKEGENLSKADVIKYCKGHSSPYKVPKVVVFKDSLPRTAITKIMRNQLRDDYISAR